MRYEIALVRDAVPVDKNARTEPSRKALREVSDKLIHDALLVNELPALVIMSAETMCVVAEILVQFEEDPQVPDLVDGAQALIECGRAVMDRGLMLRSWETVRTGSVMLELAVRGLCATLSVPYDAVLAEVHRANQAGQNPLVRPILVAAGILKAPTEEPSPNEGAANEG
jgi:hypothetical protein